MADPQIRRKAELLAHLQNPDKSDSIEVNYNSPYGPEKYYVQRPYHDVHASSVMALERSGNIVFDSCCYVLADSANKRPKDTDDG